MLSTLFASCTAVATDTKTVDTKTTEKPLGSDEVPAETAYDIFSKIENQQEEIQRLNKQISQLQQQNQQKVDDLIARLAKLEKEKIKNKKIDKETTKETSKEEKVKLNQKTSTTPFNQIHSKKISTKQTKTNNNRKNSTQPNNKTETKQKQAEPIVKVFNPTNKVSAIEIKETEKSTKAVKKPLTQPKEQQINKKETQAKSIGNDKPPITKNSETKAKKKTGNQSTTKKTTSSPKTKNSNKPASGQDTKEKIGSKSKNKQTAIANKNKATTKTTTKKLTNTKPTSKTQSKKKTTDKTISEPNQKVSNKKATDKKATAKKTSSKHAPKKDTNVKTKVKKGGIGSGEVTIEEVDMSKFDLLTVPETTSRYQMLDAKKPEAETNVTNKFTEKPSNKVTDKATTANNTTQTKDTGSKIYLHALKSFSEEKTDTAIRELKKYIQQHPDGKLIAKANYWLGESYLQKDPANYAAARFYFLEVINKYNQHPNNDKHSKALYRLCQLSKINNYDDDLIKYAKKLQSDYPTSVETKLATELLKNK